MEVREPSAKYLARSGYKRTEVGVIPEDWVIAPLESVTPPNLKSGIVDGPFGSNLKTIHYRTSGIPIITSGYVTDGKFRAEKYLYVDRAKFLEEKRSSVQPGDIVMAKIGERCGASAILPDMHETGILSGNALKITVDTLKHSTVYIWQILWNLHSSGKMESLRTVGAQPAISMANLKKHKIPLPPTKAEQEAIAEALSDADALIESLEQLLAKKRNLKQGAMQELLTRKKRLPGFNGEWKLRMLGECLLSQPDYGINAAAVPFSDKLPSYLRITDISEDGRFFPNPRVSVKASNADQYFLHPGDIVFARTGASVGKSYLYDAHDGKLVFAGFLIRVRPNPAELVPAFLAASVRMGAYWNWVHLMSMRSGQPGINGNEYAQLPLTLPPLSEQTAIAAILSDMDAEIAALEAKLAKARNLKQGMMQELLTGRIRLI